ncbi:MAG: C39 family peptidase [Chloroflexi bacterium]|nr:C39 family peptidase [Chloroflexota bacterium]
MPTLPVPHREQTRPSDCLAACVAMVLDYLGQPVPYDRLLALLSIGPFGAPRRNVIRLERLGLRVTYREATTPLIAAHLRAGQPVIAFVDTGELSYWSTASNHAVVVVGIDVDMVLVNDPAFANAPQRVVLGEFELAWLNADNACAIIER